MSDNKAFLPDNLYNTLKWVAQIFLPAVGTLYFTLAGIWGLPKADEVVGTIMAVDLFLGLLLGLSNVQYNKSGARFDGQIDVQETDAVKTYSMEVKGDPEVVLQEKDELTFKVNKDLEEVPLTPKKRTPRKARG